ncbi:MAG: M24 family metallopeptidase [Candidatus Brocadiia bacterium]
MSAHPQRMDRLRYALRQDRLDALLVAHGANVTYLSGFRGDSACLLVGADRTWLVTDGRYAEQAQAEAPRCELVVHDDSLLAAAAGTCSQAGLKRVGFETTALTVADHERFVAALDGAETVGRKDLVENLRAVKDEGEIELIREAAAAADAAFRALRDRLAPGQSERQAAARLDYEMRLHGASKPAFDTIVAGRERASLPHAEATDAVLRPGDAVLIDWGAVRRLYCSDCTRMLFLGPPDDRWRAVYEAVRAAQEAAREVVRPGVALREVDAAARRSLDQAGHGEAFVHGLGHGVGLRVHEQPSLSRRAEGQLAEGMVVTLEPGVYLPGWGGVRIEDLVVVRADGAEVLSSLPKTLDTAILCQ